MKALSIIRNLSTLGDNRKRMGSQEIGLLELLTRMVSEGSMSKIDDECRQCCLTILLNLTVECPENQIAMVSAERHLDLLVVLRDIIKKEEADSERNDKNFKSTWGGNVFN
jgi:hypothetical protein